MVNKVILIGRLGKDAEVRRLENGAAVAKVSLATNETYRDKEGNWQELTEWHDIVGWRYTAEKMERDFKKGKLAYVEGKLTTRKWQDKDGNNRYTTEVVANQVRLLERREDGGGSYNSMPSAGDMPAYMQGNNNATSNNPNPPASTNTASANTASTTAPTPQPEEVTDAAGDDLPF